MKPTPDKGRWGILGGTFNPIHRGHLALADGVRRKAGLTGVIFVPSVKHPLKTDQPQAPFADRAVMVRLAVEDYECFAVSEIEYDQHLSGYTVDTISALKKQYPQAKFFFVIGADNIADLDRWHDLDSILKEVTILVGSRPGWEADRIGVYLRDGMELVSSEPVDVSSTEVRHLVEQDASDEALDKLVPVEVRRYIRQKGLYG